MALTGSWAWRIPTAPLASQPSLFSFSCSEAILSALRHLTGVLLSICVYFSLLMGGGEFRVLLCSCPLGPLNVTTLEVSLSILSHSIERLSELTWGWAMSHHLYGPIMKTKPSEQVDDMQPSGRRNGST